MKMDVGVIIKGVQKPIRTESVSQIQADQTAKRVC